MALTAKERARRWRERQKEDPEKHQKYLQAERERYQSRKTSGKLKAISELTERQKRAVRKQWRTNQTHKRQKDKNAIDILTVNTPPDSPDERAPAAPSVDMRKSTGRKRVRRDRAKAYRELQKLKMKLQKKEQDIEKYRKRLQREKAKIIRSTDSPRTRTKQLLRGQSVSREVRRMLQFHHTLVKGLRDKYKQAKKRKTKKAIVNILPSNLIRKYKLQSLAAGVVGFSRKRNLSKGRNTLKPRRNARIQTIQTTVKVFLQRDDNSRSSAGKKETITRFKVKKQKRFLNDDMKHLHAKFVSENPEMGISYSLFCRFRPFWVVKATEKDRQTCLCIKHENLQYKADKLKDLGIITTSNLNSLSEMICCNSNTKACVYRECLACSDKRVTTQITENDLGKQVQWKKWATRRLEKIKKVLGEEIKYTTSVTTREEEQGTVGTLIEDFQTSLNKACRHLYNIKHQYAALRNLRENMNANEVVIHIDFSENYSCKYDKEIQSVHFGPNQTQITLHTGVVYHKGECVISFCTVSDYNKHGPSAIWAHLKPVLNHVKEIYSTVDTVYFVSDGPTTQYRCKSNFFLLSSYFLDLGFRIGNWTFLEAGHGKGPADGIGGAVKRSADAFVAHGGSINDAQTMISALQNTGTIKFYLVTEAEVQSIQDNLPTNLDTVPNTMKLHQVYTNRRHSVEVRVLSCFCEKPDLCPCFQPMSFTFANSNSATTDSTPSTENSAETYQQSVDSHLVGKWCVVNYDDIPYPGVVQNVDDDDLEVQVMHKIGTNRYFWPMMPDILWYKHSQLLCEINEPSKVGTRHYQLSKSDWAKVIKMIDL